MKTLSVNIILDVDGVHEGGCRRHRQRDQADGDATKR